MKGELPDATPPTWLGDNTQECYPPAGHNERPYFYDNRLGGGDHSAIGLFMYTWGSHGSGWGNGTNGESQNNYVDGNGDGWFVSSR
jgi:hypothetical protein